ncbi:uncharacterized protein LOC106665148 isoform X3 [Cimex lectularius]|uniref:Uncharacterized protein n=1 Tax=Cimex lectularius TaxID=79782 RepID=A0A8I6RKV3_CIMLE|nr:uncharacterized protein LOC106665148 isoform X3 [Cimex lectularius]
MPPKKHKKMCTLTCSKANYLRALKEIREKHMQRPPLEKYSQTRKISIMSFCHNDQANIFTGIPASTHLLLAELHKSIYKHDWSACAKCIEFLLGTNKYLLPLVWKSLVLVLLCHPNSTKKHLQDFLQMLLCLRTTVEQDKFIHQLLTLSERMIEEGQESKMENDSDDDL